jgi:hypothetical protein
MAFGDVLDNVKQIIAVGTSAATSVQKVTGAKPNTQTCAYPDGSRLEWPIGTPCPATNPNGSALTQTELLGIGALIIAAIVVVLVVVLK